MSDDKNELSLEKTLEILDPINLLVEVQGEAYKIRHFKYLETMKVIQVLKQHSESIPWDLMNMNVNTDTDVMFKRVLESLGECGEALMEIIKIHLKKDDEWAETLEVDEVVNLVLAILKANADFFVQTLLPLIPAMTQSEPKS